MTRRLLGTLLAGAALCCCQDAGLRSPDLDSRRDADVLVVGAGIAGLSAALEAARNGTQVMVFDMSSVFGGHAVVAHGGLSIIGSPVQAQHNIVDSPELAARDFLEWGRDAEPEWVRYYVSHSRTEIYDWLRDLGVEFGELWSMPGNSVARFHNVNGRGLGLVTPIYLACLRAGVTFRWNMRVDELIQEGSVVGIRTTHTRSGIREEFRAPAVVLATGGFQSDIERVRNHWAPGLPFPDRFLAGSGWNSLGSGLDLAAKIGGRLHRLDHQWNYVTGLPDPRYPEGLRGLNVLHDEAIWVNLEGRRFVNECLSARDTLPALLEQPTGSYWAVFDSRGKDTFQISGSGWNAERIDRLIFHNADLVKTGATVRDLADAAGLPQSTLEQTVDRFNDMVARGEDLDYGRFGSQVGLEQPCNAIKRLTSPPYYALRMYPLARKSMGGVQIDLGSRVIGQDGAPIRGLYAAGEVTGFGGINGQAGLEGTFLGPALVTGRVAARTLVDDLRTAGYPVASGPGESEAAKNSNEEAQAASPQDDTTCLECHKLTDLLANSRPGYLHFELSHSAVMEQALPCIRCHAELAPYTSPAHRIDPLRHALSCRHCHGL